MAKNKDLMTKMQEEGILRPASEIASRPQQIISVSPATDLGLSGGIPRGSWVNISGKQKSGKSTKSLWIAAKSMQQFDDVIVFYIDAEGRIQQNSKILKGIKGLDLDRIHVISSKQGRIMSAEELLNTAAELIALYPGCVLIIDSTSSLCSSSELVGEVSGNTRSLGPKIMASFCRKMCSVVPINNCVVISIMHLIANTSGYGASQYEDSGNKIQYQSDVKLRCKGTEKIEVGDKQVGQTVKWSVEWSALGPPGALIKNYIRYGIGIDECMELAEIGTDLGFITKGGAWYTMEFTEDKKKIQGQENVRNFLEENEAEKEELYSQIKSVLAC